MKELDLLIHRYLEGSLPAEEAAELRERLSNDSAARRRLAEMAFDHAQLKDLLAPEPAEAPDVEAPLAPRPARSRWHLAAAASILVAVTIALVVGFGRREVAVDGRPAAPSRPGARVEGPATFSLEDGSRAELAPRSAAVLRTRGVSLKSGRGRFSVAKGKDAFRVETEAGNVGAFGGDFTVELRPQERRAEGPPRPPALAVSVAEGSVRVEPASGRKPVELKAPESRVFGEPDPRKPSPEGDRGRIAVRGKVVRNTEGWVEVLVDEPAEMRGQRITVRPGRAKTDGGGEGPVKAHVALLRRLKTGEPVSLGVRRADEDYELADPLEGDPKREERKGDPPRPKDPERGDKEKGEGDKGDKRER